MKKWWQYLLMIPVCLLVDVFVCAAAARFDLWVAEGQQGHPAPFATILVLAVFGSITIIVSVYAVIKCVVALRRAHTE